MNPEKPLPVISPDMFTIVLDSYDELLRNLSRQKEASWIRQASKAIDVMNFPKVHHKEGETLKQHEDLFHHYAGEQEGFKIAIDYVETARRSFILNDGRKYTKPI